MACDGWRRPCRPGSSYCHVALRTLNYNQAIGGNGHSGGDGGNGYGGGIYVADEASVSVARSWIKHNRANGGDGDDGGSDGDGVGGGVYNLGLFLFDAFTVIKKNYASTSHDERFFVVMHRQDQRQRLHRQDRHADLRPRRDDEDDHHRSQGRQQEGGQRDVLPGPVRQQQQFAVHQEPRHRHDPERRLIARLKKAAGGVLTAKQAPTGPAPPRRMVCAPRGPSSSYRRPLLAKELPHVVEQAVATRTRDAEEVFDTLEARRGIAQDRSVPANFTAATVPELIAAIDAANLTPEADTIELAAGTVFTLTESISTTKGPNGLPAIVPGSDISILGNGGTIERGATGSPAFRLFEVAAWRRSRSKT